MENAKHKIGTADTFSARVILVLLCFVLVGFYSLLIIPPAYSKKINSNVEVAGVKIGGKKPAAAKALLEYESQYFGQIHLVLKYKSQQFTPSLNELGIAVDIDKTIEKAYTYGRSSGFLGKLSKYYQSNQSESQIQYDIKIDDKKYNSYFTKLKKYIQKPPINASLKIENGAVVYDAGKKGSGVASEEVKEKIVTDLKAGLFKTYKLGTKVKSPLIQKQETLEAQNQANTWLKTKIEIDINYDQKAQLKKPNQKIVVSKSEIGTWISFKENYNVIEAKISKSSIKNWVESLKDKSRVQAINDKINFVNGEKVFIQKGVPGQEIVTKSLADDLVAALNQGKASIKLKTASLTPVEEIIGGVIPGRFPGKYIEIVLSQQKMYVFDGKKLFNIYLVSSGRWGMGTPQGSFKILYKSTWASCKPSPTEYTTCYMPYSMFFTNEGHAIHALPIIDGYQEGTWHLGVPVSHGCVRLGPAEAKVMYDWTPVGTPVIIH